MGTHCGCLVNGLFVSIMSWVLIGDVLTIVYLSPLCHVSIMSWVLTGSALTIVCSPSSCHGYLFGVSCQSSFCLHAVTATYCECLVNRLFASIMSWVLIGGVFSIVYFVSMRSWVLIVRDLSIVSLSPRSHGYSLGVSCQSSNCRHDVMGTHWECLVNRLFVSIKSWVPIVSVVSIVSFSP